MEKYSYIVIISKSIHTHSSLLPVKIPVNLIKDLQSIINNEDLLNLTTRRLLINKFFLSVKNVIYKFLNINRFLNFLELTLLTYLNGCSLNSIHFSLNNQSKINYLISKEKRSKHPHGQNILGTVYEFIKNKDMDDTYI